MEKFFPLSYGIRDTKKLIINILIYVLISVVVGAVSSIVTAVVGIIPLIGAIVGWLLGIVGSIVGLYVLVGIILAIIDFVKNKYLTNLRIKTAGFLFSFYHLSIKNAYTAIERRCFP